MFSYFRNVSALVVHFGSSHIRRGLPGNTGSKNRILFGVHAGSRWDRIRNSTISSTFGERVERHVETFVNILDTIHSSVCLHS